MPPHATEYVVLVLWHVVGGLTSVLVCTTSVQAFTVDGMFNLSNKQTALKTLHRNYE